MKKKRILLLGVLLASSLMTLFAQFSADKTYVISNHNDANVYMQDNGTGGVASGSFNDNSYWIFESTGNTDCYYVKNAVTEKYMQSTKTSGETVATGTSPVEICVKLCTVEGENMYGFASTDQTTYDFTSGTIGANWDNSRVQGFAATAGTNHKSFWKVVEQAMPQPVDDPDNLISLTGTKIGADDDIYLFNIDKNVWLQNNDWNTNYWTTRAEAGTRGFDINLTISNGGWVMNPKFGNNHSINYSGYYLDTNEAVSVWTFTPTSRDGYENVYRINSSDTQLSVNDSKSLVANGSAQDWQLLTRAERIAQLAAATSAVDASWLIKSPDFANADERFSAWTITRPMDGSEAVREGDSSPSYSCNRILRVSKARGASVLQTITGVPNGYYALSAQGAYSPCAFELGPTNRRNWETGNMEIIAHLYMNEHTIDLPSIYSESKLASESGFQKSVSGKDGEPTKYFPGGINQISRDIFEGYYKTGTIIVNVTDGTLTLGVKVDNIAKDDQGREWFVIDNFKLTYYGDLGAALTNAIAEGEAFTGNTTEALANALANAIATGKAVLASPTDANEIIEAAEAITSALNAAKAVDVTLLMQTIALAEAEGITIPTSVSDYLANGTSNEIEVNLRLLRNLRKLNAIDKVDISMIECSEPTNVEADYYLYNVGAGIFFSTTADWGTHIALDNPGMLIHFRPDGEWSGAEGRPVFHLSGNGWNGMNWEEEYWDKDGINKLAFVPVEGKEKVYHMCEWDNYDWHFVYDPAEDICDQNTHYWNAVQKRNWSRDTYKDNPYAQWMLVSPAAYKAAMANASEAKPLDVSHLINNPNFSKAKVDGNDNWDRGWTGIGGQMRGEDREPWMVIEWFEADANMKQTIEGLRPGMYKLSVNGFYRDGSTDNEVAKVASSQALIQNASLVAYTNEDNKVTSLLPNVTSEAGKMPGVGETRDGVTGEFVIWPWQANEYFQTGLYKTTTPIINVGSNGQLTIGIESTYNKETGSWIVVDNFRLTYLGESPYQTMSIVGDFTGGWPNGDDWSMAKHMVQDAENPNIWTYVIEDFYAEGRKYEYKAAANDSWDGYKLPDGLANADFVFGTEGYPAGHYRLVFTVNISTNELSLDVQKPTVTISENANYVASATEDALILLNRSFANEGAWNTFVVPFAISNAELKRAFGNDVEVAEYTEESADANNVTVRFQTMGTPAITANLPVLLQTNTTETNFLFKSDIIEVTPIAEGTNFDFVGSYAAETTIPNGEFFLSGNKIYKSEGKTTLKGTRAYFKAKTAGARIATLLFDNEGMTTAISENFKVKSEKPATIYDLQGRKLSTVKKGVYIVDGKKVVK